MSTVTVKVEVTNVFRRIQKAKTQTVVLPGGAGSSKTYSLCQYFILKRLLRQYTRPYNLLVLRKTRQANKLSVCEEFINMLKSLGIYNDKHFNKTDLIYTLFGNSVRFTGLDDREKIKSTQWHDIWCEEAFEFSRQDYTFLKIRLYRGALDKNQTPRIYMSYNPFDCWIFDLEGKEGVTFIYSTYKDNPFVNAEYKATLEALKEEDETAYNVYALGVRSSYKHIIYKPYMMLDTFPEEFDETWYGLDFGFNNPSAVIQINSKDNELYLRELFYESKYTNGMLIDFMNELATQGTISKNDCYYADSAEPARIQEIEDAGFNIYPADKSVKDGIDYCRRKLFRTLADNVNLNDEREVYKYKEDRAGNIHDWEPVKFKDHLMDAKRYGVYTHLAKRVEPNIRFI